jgi:peptidoglycan/LPS O-acetylase OafA/YrhL
MVCKKTPEQQTASSSPLQGHLPALDGLRSVAIGAVLLTHSHYGPLFFKGGWIGVDLFFVISGFIITTLLVNEFQATGTLSIGSFYYRRLVRLFPPLLAVCLLYLPVASYLHWEANDTLSNSLWQMLTYRTNIYFAHTGGDGFYAAFQHLWSLAAEEQYCTACWSVGGLGRLSPPPPLCLPWPLAGAATCPTTPCLGFDCTMALTPMLTHSCSERAWPCCRRPA